MIDLYPLFLCCVVKCLVGIYNYQVEQSLNQYSMSNIGACSALLNQHLQHAMLKEVDEYNLSVIDIGNYGLVDRDSTEL